MLGNGGHGAIAFLAPYLFFAANVVIGVILLATLWLMLRGGVLPPAVPARARAAQ
jgi:tellurite resistance protein